MPQQKCIWLTVQVSIERNFLKHTETWEHTSWPNSCNSETLWAHRIAAVRSQSNSGRAYENFDPQAPKTSHFHRFNHLQRDSLNCIRISSKIVLPWVPNASCTSSFPKTHERFWHNSTNAARWNKWKPLNVLRCVHTFIAVLLWARADLKWYAWKYSKIDGS